MINQFRSLNPANLLLLAAFTVFMRAGIFVRLPAELHIAFLEQPYAQFFEKYLKINALSGGKNAAIALIIVYVQALFFNRIINNNALLSKPGYLPGLLYITCSSLFLPFMILSPPLICNFLIISMIEKFLKMAKEPSAMAITFDIGMIVAFGTLIYFPFLALWILVWLGLLLFRPFNWREWLCGLLGFLTIFFLLTVYYYWNDRLEQFYQIWKTLTNKYPSSLKINYLDYLTLIPVAVIFVLAILQLWKNFFRSFINTRKGFQLLFFMFLLSVVSFYMEPNFRVYHFLLAVPSGSVLLAYYFSNAKKRWFYELLFVLLIISIQCFLLV